MALAMVLAAEWSRADEVTRRAQEVTAGAISCYTLAMDGRRSRNVLGIAILVFAVTGGGQGAVADACEDACDADKRTCLTEVDEEVAVCQARMRQRCGQACPCPGQGGAAEIACLQRCEFCMEWMAQIGVNCPREQDIGRASCADVHDDCKRRCE